MKVALLDANDVFLGQREIDPADFNPAVHINATEYGGDCDNAPGEYRWNREAKRFDPLHALQEQMAADFNTIVAFAAAQALSSNNAQIGGLVKKYFPDEYNAAKAEIK